MNFSSLLHLQVNDDGPLLQQRAGGLVYLTCFLPVISTHRSPFAAVATDEAGLVTVRESLPDGHP